MAYDQSVRKLLNSKGVQNSDIGYDANTGFVKVKGQNFIKPQKTYSGTSFTDQANFNNAYNSYTKNQANNVADAAVGTVAGTGNMPPTSTQQKPINYVSQRDDLIGQLVKQFNSPSSFDPYSTAAYQGAQAQQNKNAQQGIRAAQEALGNAGFGRSTTLAQSAQMVQNDADNHLMTQVVPQILAQEEAKKRQQFQDTMNIINSLTGLDQQGFDREQQGWENRFNYGQSIGQFGNGQKTTQQKQLEYGQQTDQRDFNYQKDQDALAQKNLNDEKSYRKQRDSAEDKKWWSDYQRDGQQFAARQGLDWAQLNQRQKEQAADEAYRAKTLKLDQDKFEYSKDPKNPDNIPKTKENNKMNSEKQGLTNAIRSGEVSPYNASIQIDKDVELGFYSTDEAKELKELIRVVQGQMVGRDQQMPGFLMQ